MGRISHLISTAQTLETPLTRKIGQFSHVLLYAIVALAALTFGIGLFRGETMIDMFMTAVALAVGAIPEGLPAALTITLAIGVSKLARRSAVIRKLPAVETLGRTTVICSDQTGTLTQNQMAVQKIHADDEAFDAAGTDFSPEGQIRAERKRTSEKRHRSLIECLRARWLCNDSHLVNQDGK